MTERLTDEARQTGWLIHKEGRGWYRPNAQGYTSRTEEAGRYSHKDALSYSHPNGWSGPRDGITIRHENDLARRATPAEDMRAAASAILNAMDRAQIEMDVLRLFMNGQPRAALTALAQKGGAA